MTEQYIKSMLNRCFPQEGLSMVKKSDLDYSMEIQGGWIEINKILNSWQEFGLIKLIKYPDVAEDTDVCVRILKFLDGKNCPPNWIRGC